MLANLDEQEQQQDQATLTPQEEQAQDPGDRSFDPFEEEVSGPAEKVDGFYGPLATGDENDGNGSGDQAGKPGTTQTQGEGNPQDQQPIRFVKYQGRDIPIYSKDEEEGLIAKGMDYTAKTMALAPWRKRVEYLYQNPDKLQIIDRLMGGEEVTPEALASLQKGADPQGQDKGDDKPVQNDDETFEAFTERLSEWKARKIVKAELDEFRQTTAKREFQAAAMQDPLMPYITQAINADMQSGLLPEEVFKAADNDPTAAAKLYGAYRKRIVGMIEQQKASEGNQATTPGRTAPAQQQPAVPSRTAPARQGAPFAESGRGARRAPSANKDATAQVFRDMKLNDFEAFVDRLKSGG